MSLEESWRSWQSIAKPNSPMTCQTHIEIWASSHLWVWQCHGEDSEDWLPQHLSLVPGRVLSSLWHSCTSGTAVTGWFEVCCIYTWRSSENILSDNIPCFGPLKTSVSQKNARIPCVPMGTQGPERELETAQIFLPVCVTSCSTPPTEVTTTEKMKGVFSFQNWQTDIKKCFFFLVPYLSPVLPK